VDECKPLPVVGRDAGLDVAAQIEFESKVREQFLMFWFQVLRSRRFQLGFYGVNLLRPTLTSLVYRRAGANSLGLGSPASLRPGAYTRPLFSST
jgi:hypothetical protein